MVRNLDESIAMHVLKGGIFEEKEKCMKVDLKSTVKEREVFCYVTCDKLFGDL